MLSNFGILYALLALSFLIFFHELGHFLVARFFGVKVEVFSIGFGKKIFQKKIGETTYCISAIPLGGYVQMKGQSDFDPTKRNPDSDSFNTKAPWQRIFILIAGPFANFLLAFFIYIIIGNLGAPGLSPKIGKITDGSPAFTAGLLNNDTIKKIDGKEIKDWSDIKPFIANGSEFVDLLVERDKKSLHVVLAPKLQHGKNIFGENIEVRLLGISPTYKKIKVFYAGLDSVEYAWGKTIDSSYFMFQSIQKLVTGVLSPKELSGPIGIVEVSSKVSKQGFVEFLILVALISVNLAVLNLLPIPALDGGHIIFNLYEMIFRKAPSEKIIYLFTLFGWAILLSLMFFTTGNDIFKIITKGSVIPQ